jgi:hypothetical protein
MSSVDREEVVKLLTSVFDKGNELSLRFMEHYPELKHQVHEGNEA